jgi:hypothetical protein
MVKHIRSLRSQLSKVCTDFAQCLWLCSWRDGHSFGIGLQAWFCGLATCATVSSDGIVLQIAILCFGDLVEVMRESMLEHVDMGAVEKPLNSALCQLLLKAVSNDKKFVLEAARKVLHTCARCLDSQSLLGRLLPYTNHKCAPPHGLATCTIRGDRRDMTTAIATCSHNSILYTSVTHSTGDEC